MASSNADRKDDAMLSHDSNHMSYTKMERDTLTDDVGKQHWAVIDAIEEHIDVDRYLLSAAYSNLAQSYEENNQNYYSRRARLCADRVLDTNRDDLPEFVFSFYIEHLQEAQKEKDKVAISAAYTRLADVQRAIGVYKKVVTPREQHWRIIDEMERNFPRPDQFAIAAAYDKLGDVCAHVGDTLGANRARNASKIILMANNVERQQFFLDQMEESDEVDLEQLAKGYTELACLQKQAGLKANATQSEKDAGVLMDIYEELGKQKRTPRSVWRADKRLTPRSPVLVDNSPDVTPVSAQIYSPRPKENASSTHSKSSTTPLQQHVKQQKQKNSSSSDGAEAAATGLLPAIGGSSNPNSSNPNSPAVSPVQCSNERVKIDSMLKDAALSPSKEYAGEVSAVQFEQLRMEEPLVQIATNSPFRKKELTPIVSARTLTPGSNNSTRLNSAASEIPTQNSLTLDCTNQSMHMLEDALLAIRVKLVHLKAEFSEVRKLKGKCSISLSYTTGIITLDYKWAYQTKFNVLHEGKVYQGYLHLFRMTKQTVMDESNPFPIEFTWQDGISPTGVDFNQVVAILTSSKMRHDTRQAYLSWENAVIKELVPRFQQKQRAAGPREKEGKKAVMYNMKQEMEVLKSTHVQTRTRGGLSFEKEEVEAFSWETQGGNDVGGPPQKKLSLALSTNSVSATSTKDENFTRSSRVSIIGEKVHR